MKLNGEVAVITGAGSGIGEAIARRFGEEGALLALIDNNGKKLEELSSVLRNKGINVEFMVADVSNSTQLEIAFDYFNRIYGKVDILVNNAGIWNEATFLELTEENWNRVISVNLTGMFLCSQKAARIMVKQNKGVIINMSSTAGEVAEPKLAHYTSSKGGVVMLTKSMSIDLAPYGIRVIGIAPGTINTPLISHILSKNEEYFANPPIGRVGKPSEVASLATFLASSEASFITGSIHLVDGGELAITGDMPSD
ncbi:SDR family NAD(P)-dependent oxidoreductase [Lederbergia citrea]|uniref:SDR family NAD(P)-dependent oxidoreductase n=1 Tax=Lederbergia citrea TaxID=2833581 RepID=UPI001BCA316D|nr:glucose 1-dehydrogenase [Lederbergia citrea]MBS4178803.1 glucose 1-dehydrogenase [Lederbergia citrea]